MRRFAASLVLLGLLLSTAGALAGEGRVCKVLPQFLDKKGRQSLEPSLYERDAYQFYLRKHPAQRATLRMAVQYKAKGLDWDKTVMRVELRGLKNDTLATTTVESPIKKSGFFANWAYFSLTGDAYKKFGDLVAWRVSLWEGTRELSEQESFLWSGVPPP
jgi:hypothetical protein